MKTLLVLAMLTIALAQGGCKKKEQPAPPTQPPTAEEMQITAEKMAASVEQTMCPVMDGMKIDKNVFVEYKGQKVYFCCGDCKAKFEADPEKYAANLPQFKK